MNGLKKTLLSIATLVLGTAMSVSVAQAVPFSGSVAFNGGPGGVWIPEDATGNQTNILNATQIDFVNNIGGLTVTASDGDIAAAGIVAGSVGDIADFSFDPLGGFVNPLFNIGSLTFNLQNIQVDFSNNNVLVLSGSGLLNLPGFSPTPGRFDFTGNQSGNSLSFSGGVATPEPGTMLLMGSGLVGLGLWRKLKK